MFIKQLSVFGRNLMLYAKKMAPFVLISFGFLSIIFIVLYMIFYSSLNLKLFKIDLNMILAIWGLIATIFLGIYQIKLAIKSNKQYLEQQNSLCQQINGILSSFGGIYSKLLKAIKNLTLENPNIENTKSELLSAIGSFESLMNSSSLTLNQMKYSIIKDKIEIISAFYRQVDDKSKSKDLTALIISKFENMKYSFPVVPNELGGDPFPNIKKELVIKYKYKQRELEIAFEDFYLASLP